jgi:CheY-like chemotaxis protein
MKKTKWILLAEDDAPMAELTVLALTPDALACEIVVARDGLEALDCLHRRGNFQTRADGDPAFVLLDLNMPKVDGLEVLRQIKTDARFRYIPVIVFTSSRELTDVCRSYQLGANAYVVKPADFGQFSAALGCVGRFWAEVNELPEKAGAAEPEHSDREHLAAMV